jgi:hypothetical protein
MILLVEIAKGAAFDLEACRDNHFVGFADEPLYQESRPPPEMARVKRARLRGGMSGAPRSYSDARATRTGVADLEAV